MTWRARKKFWFCDDFQFFHSHVHEETFSIVAHFSFILLPIPHVYYSFGGCWMREAKVPQGKISSKIVDNAGDIMTWRKMKLEISS